METLNKIKELLDEELMRSNLLFHRDSSYWFSEKPFTINRLFGECYTRITLDNYKRLSRIIYNTGYLGKDIDVIEIGILSNKMDCFLIYSLPNDYSYSFEFSDIEPIDKYEPCLDEVEAFITYNYGKKPRNAELIKEYLKSKNIMYSKTKEGLMSKQSINQIK